MIAYYAWETATFDDKIMLNEKSSIELGEKIPDDIAEFVDWDELWKLCRKQKQNWFRVEKKRKGRVFRDPIDILVKEWRKPDFSVYHEILYFEANPSIMDILNYPDIEKAAQYLKERGINIMEDLR